IAVLGRAHDLEPPPPDGEQAPPPAARVDPDQSLGWYRRVRPLLVARKGQVLLGLGCALVAMLAQVVAPRVLMTAIDQALDEGGSPLGPFVTALLVIAVVRGALTLTYRSVLFRAAYG